MPEPRSARLAVLIDADNASPRIADGLFDEIAKMGEASVRRIYGDFLARLWPIRRLGRARKSSIVEGPVRVLACCAGAGT